MAFPFLLTAPATASPSDAQRMELGRNFYSKIGKKLQEADILLQGGNKLRLAELRSSATLAEGEPLLMQGFTGDDNVTLGSSITAIRHNGRLMMSLAEFCNAADFPIRVSSKKGTASGWFFREDRSFYLDVEKRIVTLRGESYKVDPEDLMLTEDDILVSSAVMEKWFDIQIDIDLSSLSYNVSGPLPLPVEERRMRGRRQKYAPESQAAKAPMHDIPYKMLTAPYLDVTLGASASKSGASIPQKTYTSWSAIGAGDVAKLSSRTYVSGDQDNGVSSLRQTFGRADPEGWGLGPAQVRAFSFGDVYTPIMPLVGGGAQEQGVFLSSRPPGMSTTLNQTDIRGDAQPGWSVELYNNDALIGFQDIGTDGRYIFENVFLAEENNNLKLVFYGPHGEIREEKRNIVANTPGLAAGRGVWDVSLSRANTTTYDAEKAKTPIDGDPQLFTRYEQSLGAFGSVNTGFVHRSETDNILTAEKNYLQGGIATNIRNVLVTSNLAYDTQGAYSADALARHNFGQHQAGLLLGLSSGDFSLGTLTSFAPKSSEQVFLRGPLAAEFMGIKSLTYSVDATRLTSATDAVSSSLTTGLSGRYKNVTISDGLIYNATDVVATDTTASSASNILRGYTVANGFWGKGRWRLSSAYELQPFTLSSFSGNYSFPVTDEFSAVTNVAYNLASGITDVQLSGNWRAQKFSLAPYISANTDHRFATGVNVRFSVAKNPYGGYQMTSASLTDSGGMAGRVFLDKNGDGIYNDGEELLPEAQISALQSGRTAETNEKGIAFTPELPSGLRTDIALNPDMLPDPYYITMDDGVSIRPRPGITAQFDFPVVVAGEMDGTAEYTGEKKQAARNARISLIAPDGKVEKSAIAAFDGYWSISTVRPGVYYLTAETNESAPSGYALPVMLSFNADGSNYFSKPVSFTPGHNTRFRFISTNEPPWGRRHTRVVKPDDIGGQEISLEVGDFYSPAALTVGWYKLKLRNRAQMEHLTLAMPLSKVLPDPKDQLMHLPLLPAAPLTMESAAQECQDLQNFGFSCTVKVMTHYREPEQDLAQALNPPHRR